MPRLKPYPKPKQSNWRLPTDTVEILEKYWQRNMCAQDTAIFLAVDRYARNQNHTIPAKPKHGTERKKITCHVPVELQSALDALVAQYDVSELAVVDAAIRQELKMVYS